MMRLLVNWITSPFLPAQHSNSRSVFNQIMVVMTSSPSCSEQLDSTEKNLIDLAIGFVESNDLDNIDIALEM